MNRTQPDDLAKRMRRWAEDAPIAQRSELRVVMKAWADEVEADRKAREDHDLKVCPHCGKAL